MADAKDFLFEIGTEEMPSAPLNNAVKQLGTMIAKGRALPVVLDKADVMVVGVQANSGKRPQVELLGVDR